MGVSNKEQGMSNIEGKKEFLRMNEMTRHEILYTTNYKSQIPNS